MSSNTCISQDTYGMVSWALVLQCFGDRINTMWMLNVGRSWQQFLPLPIIQEVRALFTHCFSLSPHVYPEAQWCGWGRWEAGGREVCTSAYKAITKCHLSGSLQMQDSGSGVLSPVICVKCGILGGLNVWAAAWVKLLGQFNSAMLNFN